MRDRLALLLTAVVAAGLSWALFHFAGQDAFQMLTLVFIVGLAIDNVRLRRRLRRQGAVGDDG